MAVIMGVDPGSRITGFGVIRLLGHEVEHVSHGVILLPEGRTLAEKLFVLSDCLQKLFLKHQPQSVSVEKIFLGKNADSAFKLGHARGVVLMEAARVKAEVCEYATRLVKKGVTGRGSADKEEVKQVLLKLLRLKNIDKIDASDALALALYHAQKVSSLHRWHRLKEVPQ